jgi:SOS-response transcriptional repressor LexA
MTKRQKECLDFILLFWKENGYGPSYQEISEALGTKNKSSAYRMVNLLCQRGQIVKHAGRARGIYPLGTTASDSPNSGRQWERI